MSEAPANFGRVPTDEAAGDAAAFAARRAVAALDGDASRPTGRGPVRVRTLTNLRWLAVGGQTAAILFVHFGLGYPLELGFCLAAIAASAWRNLCAYMHYARQRYLSDQEATLFIIFDILQICALLGLTGGLHNPFAVLILAPVTIAASVAPLRLALLTGAVAIAGVTAIALFHLPLPWRPEEVLALPRIYTFGLWAALSFAVAFFGAYAHRISAEAGQMKSALAQTQLALAREERLAAIGGLAAAAARDHGPPLATIQVTAKEMAGSLKTADVDGADLLREDAGLLVSQAERCRDILSRLSRGGAEDDALLRRVSLDILMQEAAGPFADAPGGPAVIFDLVGADTNRGGPPIVERRAEIIYGLRNFIENAAAFARSKVLVAARWTDETVTISVHDDGPGFPADVLARLGEPYVSARTARKKRGGLGLGFFIAKTLLERTGARVAFANRPWDDGRGGAWVAIAWPRAAIEAARPARGAGASPPENGSTAEDCDPCGETPRSAAASAP
ncbi:MAG: ActS/PrrB/RegB family redox-sensitive histidine kinase [Parvularculaceae bacterium]